MEKEHPGRWKGDSSLGLVRIITSVLGRDGERKRDGSKRSLEDARERDRKTRGKGEKRGNEHRPSLTNNPSIHPKNDPTSALLVIRDLSIASNREDIRLDRVRKGKEGTRGRGTYHDSDDDGDDDQDDDDDDETDPPRPPSVQGRLHRPLELSLTKHAEKRKKTR